MKGTTRDGSTADITVEFGTASTFDSVGSPPDLTPQVLTDCGRDPDRDLAIPGQITVRSTTTGFTSDFGAGLYLYGIGIEHMPGLVTPQGAVRVEAVIATGGIPQCDAIAGSGVYAIVTHFSLAPGQEQSASFYITLKDYLSPAAPVGDEDMLHSLFFRPSFGGAKDVEMNANATGGDGMSITAASGDGLLVDTNLGHNWLLSPLGGKVVTSLLLPETAWTLA